MVLYGLGIILSILALLYLIVKRVKDKKGESFEKRDH